MSQIKSLPSESPWLTDRIRGVPAGAAPFPASEIAEKRWRPAEGAMALPVLTLDEAAFVNNRDLMLRYAAEHGALIAPHAKTPMAPALARSLVEGGAWAATVADTRQAAVMADAGILRLIHANEAGGLFGARRLASFVAQRPYIEIYVFADSLAAVQALDAAWRDNPRLPPLRALVEVGAGRAGARTFAEAKVVAEAIAATQGRLTLAGVATYEGSAARATLDETLEAIAALMTLAADALAVARGLAGPNTKLIITAGGSAYFDLVVGGLKLAIERDGRTSLVLRSGSIFFHDHGIYDRSLAALDERAGFELGGEVLAARSAFRPALRVWAEVLSRPEPDLAICGLGMRDVSFDHDLPKPLVIHRAGRALASAPAGRVMKLNDQHAFLAVAADDEITVGDIVEFGVSHPCTTLDRYSFIFGVDEQGFVRNAFPTYFG